MPEKSEIYCIQQSPFHQRNISINPYLVVSQPYGIIRISDIEVERHAPHDDQPHVDLNQLPGDGATGPHHGVGVLHNHHFLITREYVSWRKKLASFATFRVCFHIK